MVVVMVLHIMNTFDAPTCLGTMIQHGFYMTQSEKWMMCYAMVGDMEWKLLGSCVAMGKRRGLGHFIYR